ANDLEDDYLIVWRREGTEVGRLGEAPSGVPFPQVNQGHNYNSHRTRKDFREVFRILRPGDCLLLGKSLEAERRQWRGLAWQLVGSGFGILALGLLGGWWFLSRALRPVHSISRAARHFAGGHLETRIPGPGEGSGGELGQLTDDLNETFDQLEQAFARQRRFTADAAHELRTPVAVILSHAQAALVRDRGPEAYKNALATCERGAKRLQQLIDSLLTLTVLDAGVDPGPIEEVDLAGVARESAEFLSPLAEAGQLTWHWELEPASCPGWPRPLRQVLTNLIANAIHFSEPGGRIRIASGSDSGRAWVAVSDEGKGIGEEHLPHLFERFYRADPSRKRGDGGAGLGLAICQEIIRSHGGRIEVQSKPGEGTIFTIEIPVVSNGPPVLSQEHGMPTLP
ncbi:MAG: HAMP domain-containing sensor histidine kinase, partial [Verrucomicrobiota bacterium]